MTKRTEILKLHLNNFDPAQIAKKVKCSRVYVYDVLKKWKASVGAQPLHKAIEAAYPDAPIQLPPETPATTKASDRQVGGSHYKDMGVQTWDVVDTWPREQRIGYYRGGALKYLMRMGSKDQDALEIAKGQHYLEKLLEVLNAS